MNFTSFLPAAVRVMFSSDPTVFALQVGAVIASAAVIYTVLFVTRDVIIRSRSIVFQVFSILLTAALPLAGFLLYFLMRPSTTNAERALQKDVTEMLVRLREHDRKDLPKVEPEKKERIAKFVKKSMIKQVAASEKVEEATPAL